MEKSLYHTILLYARYFSPANRTCIYRPHFYNQLEWKRKGYWNAYPKDHIGALEGTAKAFDETLPVSGLAGPSKEPTTAWSFDQTANGSNIFRSTKENIYTAVLSGNGKERISVLSGRHATFPCLDRWQQYTLFGS